MLPWLLITLTLQYKTTQKQNITTANISVEFKSLYHPSLTMLQPQLKERNCQENSDVALLQLKVVVVKR